MLNSLIILLFISLNSVSTIASDGNSNILWKDVCTQDGVRQLPFCNISLSIEERSMDYVARIPLINKTKMMGHRAAGFDPLHIPPYQWWSEGAHGAMQPCVSVDDTTKCATSFPCPSALGTAFNNTLYNLIGSIVGREGRAFSNLRNHNMDVGDGLDYWSPVVNLQRDPRWGRNQEVPGEDPFLTSRFAVNYIRGLQQLEKYPVQVAACCKHFVGNSLENWHNVTRDDFNAEISLHDLNSYYLVPFRACVEEAGVLGIMCSYNAVNDVPMCANDKLLRVELREKWGFKGYVTSDCWALTDIFNTHHYVTTPQEAAALSLKATTDVNCGVVYQDHLENAVQKGLASEEEVNESFTRLVQVQMKLGLFDNNKGNFEVSKFALDQIDTPEHQQLALEAAQQSIVLLKNTNNTLPLSPGRKVAILGPHFYATEALLSNYHGQRCAEKGCIQTPFNAIWKANGKVEIRGDAGCHINETDWNGIDKATKIAEWADTIILTVGLDQTQERETLDRIETTLPGLQNDLVKAILKLQNPQTVLVLFNGGSVSLGPDILEQTPAIVDAFYGGQAASQALADVLFGHYNPSGKLAATMYPPSFVNDIPMTEMGINVGVGRTHMYYKGTPEFPFGHGLSYSQWSLQWYPFDMIGSKVVLQINVANLGPLSGRQTVLVFRTSAQEKQSGLLQSLVGYNGTQVLEAGQDETVTVELQLAALRRRDSTDQITLTAMAANTQIILSLPVDDETFSVRSS